MDDLSDIDFGNAPVTQHFSDGRRKKGCVIFAGPQGDHFRLIWKRDDGICEDVVLKKKRWFGTVNHDGIVRIDAFFSRMEWLNPFWSQPVSYELILDW